MSASGQVVTQLDSSVWQFTARLWEVNAVVVAAEGRAIVFDPTLTPPELSVIRAHTERTGTDQHVFITHSHYDHLCGIEAFPEAEIIVGDRTARVIARGTAAEQLRVAGEEWGIPWSAELRVDRVIQPMTELRFGDTTVLAVEATGNAADGLAYLLPREGLLITGDYMQPANYPCPVSLETRATYRRLLWLLDRYPIRWVISGHGQALRPDEARELAAADLAYMEKVSRIAEEVTAADLSPREAQLAVYAVTPPREALDCFEIYDQRNMIAWYALHEARERTGRTSPASEAVWKRLFAGRCE